MPRSSSALTRLASVKRAGGTVSWPTAATCGSVKITRGDHQLTGGLGEVNLATGMSRLTGATSGDGKKERVKGLILPRAVSNDGDDQSPSQ